MIFNPIYGSGGSSPSPALGSKTITANGTYLASQDNLDGYDEVTANVPNTYAAGDEGKVVSSGALVPQSSENITQNGTYDTTLKNQVVVNVSEGSPNLQAKTGLSITSNGSFSYTPDAGYDGLSEVSGIVNVSGGSSGPLEYLAPYAEDITTGYVSGGTWYYSGSTYSNLNTTVFQVEAGKTYLFMTGATAERFRAMFTTQDITQATSNITGISIANNSSATAYEAHAYTATANGYVAIYVGDRAKNAYGFIGQLP